MTQGKKKPAKQVVKCQCSRCEQIAYVEPDKPHVFCSGIRQSIIDMFPPAFKNLTNPTKKGTWRLYQEPVKEVVVPETIPSQNLEVEIFNEAFQSLTS